MNSFQSEVLRQVVGHCSHNIGWNAINASSLDLLTEVLQKYLTEIGRTLHIYSEQFGRTEPNLDDLGLTFRDMAISIQDLSDYVNNVEPTSFHEEISKFPIPKEHNLNFLKPGSHEVLSRPVHIHEHLPPIQPIIIGDVKTVGEHLDPTECLSVPFIENNEQMGTSSPHANSFKRPDGAEKRKGNWLDEEGTPVREISSVMMTSSGYLSSSREGKLPETKIRKFSVESDNDVSTADKKLNIKKVFEGIKKSEDYKKPDEKDLEVGRKSTNPSKHREILFSEDKSESLNETTLIGESQAARTEASKERENDKESENKADDSTQEERNKAKEVEKDREKEVEIDKRREQNVEKSKDREKEKLKKKRGKEKQLEEFAFFEKGSPVLTKTESTLPTDSSKQKLSVFKKFSKPKEHESLSPRSSTPSRAFYDHDRTPTASVSEVFSKGNTEESGRLSKTETSVNKQKAVKKDKKLKLKKPSSDFDLETREIVAHDDPKRKSSKSFTKLDSSSSHGESSGLFDASNWSKMYSKKSQPNTSGIPDGEQLKKKRGRPPRVETPEVRDESRTSEPESTLDPLASLMPKPFFPFPSRFPAPGLIPSPFMPANVPFNLLGVHPIGMRSPLGFPPPSSVPVSMTNISPTPIPTHHVEPRGDLSSSLQNSVLQSPSTSKSPNIVDSLPESLDVSSNVMPSEEDSISVKRKDKKEKKEKEKKKKDKKLKEKSIDESERKAKREKKKEKKDKEKDKEKSDKRDKDENVVVPKITFKFAAASISPTPGVVETVGTKLIFKGLTEKEDATVVVSGNRETSHSSSQPSVEVAKFSALITRPPKKEMKSLKKDIASSSDEPSELSTSHATPGPARTPSPSPKIRREKPQKPPRVTKEKDKEKKKMDKPGDVAIITETVGSYYDEFGNKIWICPACGRQDDGTPMIGCDECDDWYHWVCVGIRVPPAETESWFCQRCIAKKQGSLNDKKKARKKKTAP